jgi:hypothetical protein
MLGRLAGGEGAEWIQVAQDRDWGWDLVITIMNPWVLVPQRYFLNLFCNGSYCISFVTETNYCNTSDQVLNM